MGQGPLPLKAHRRRQVGLADHHHIGANEGGGVFERLVLPFAHREQHQPPVLAEVVGGRADQVAHVLDQQQVEGGQGATAGLEGLDTAGHHRRIEVAGLAGGDRHRLQAGGPQAGRVVVGGQVAHQGRHGQRTGGPMAGQGLQQGGLPGPRRGEDVHHRHAGGGEALAVAVGLVVVLLQQPQAEGNLQGCRHTGSLQGRLVEERGVVGAIRRPLMTTGTVAAHRIDAS